LSKVPKEEKGQWRFQKSPNRLISFCHSIIPIHPAFWRIRPRPKAVYPVIQIYRLADERESVGLERNYHGRVFKGTGSQQDAIEVTIERQQDICDLGNRRNFGGESKIDANVLQF
jgi:hypothetical protein